MYLNVVPVLVIFLLMVSPIIWAVWWMLAEMGDKASGTYTEIHRVA